MKRNLVKGITLATLAMLILSVLSTTAILPALAEPETKVYTDPETYIYDTDTATVCTHFNVTVKCENVVNMKTWQVQVCFDPTIINVTGWYQPTWDPNYVFFGKTTLPVPAPPAVAYTVIGPNLACATVGASLFPAPPSQAPFSGNGTLCIFTFHIERLPGKGEVLETDLDLSDPAGTYWISTESAAKIPFDTYVNGFYQITWLAPPPPYLAVVPGEKTFPYHEPAVCQNFTVDIYIMGLSPAWYLTNASFVVCFNTTLISLVDVIIDPFWSEDDNWFDWWYDEGPCCGEPGIWDRIHIIVSDSCTPPYPSGDVLVATIRFHVEYQCTSPPRPFRDSDETPIFFCDWHLFDHDLELPTGEPENGRVIIECYSPEPCPYLEVVPNDTVLGPAPAIGTEFDVDVVIRRMSPIWEMVAYQVRLTYDPELLEGVSITEGPFLQTIRWNKHGTLFISSWNTVPYTHGIAAGILWPNGGYEEWMEFPNTMNPPLADPVLATFRFRAIKQVFPETLSCVLGLPAFFPPENYHFLNKDGGYICTDSPMIINGTYTITSEWGPGRRLDLYVSNYPEGYKGRGPNEPCDMFWPQKLVILHGEVTYNYWPVQQKIVSFEIMQPCGGIVAKLTAISDEDGIATTTFRIPWPCDHEEKMKLFGKWTVVATVDIACTVVNDTMQFDFQWLASIEEETVEIDNWYPQHCDWIEIWILVCTKSWQWRPLLVSVVLKDELDVPVAICLIETEIGGAWFCHYECFWIRCLIHIPKHAFSGWATLHINCFDKDPTEGGQAYCPETVIEGIYIQPY